MEHGFVKTAAVTPKIRVADPKYNAGVICEKIKEASEKGAKIIVFPELCITGYTCGDLFLQQTLLDEALEALRTVCRACAGVDSLVLVGLPVVRRNKLYNVCAALWSGKVLCFIPKRFIPNYSEFYEARHFTPGNEDPEEYLFDGYSVPFGSRILMNVPAVSGLSVAVEICEDLWVGNAPDIEHALAGATLICNLSASDEVIGKAEYRRNLVTGVSGRTVTAYIYANAGEGESSQDLVFAGQNIIAENGSVLAEAPLFEPGILFADIDVQKLVYERRRMNTFGASGKSSGYLEIEVPIRRCRTELERSFAMHPFVPGDTSARFQRCEEIFAIQVRGLAKRLEHIGTTSAVIGISGGLDSTLALLVTARAFDMLSISRENILSVTMPCFGTTDRTYNNACFMTRSLGATLKEVNIREAVGVHFRDIGHDPDDHSVTYENSQARERTQILMDLANKTNGIVIGTGDLSELALGWATYNGDHMSMYAVNAGVPKTLVRHLVSYCADTAGSEELRKVLLDVLDTPVSPELLPPTEGGKISQKTEDLVGPYALHDFYMYYMMRFGFAPDKIFRMALRSFEGIYDRETILKWLRKFYWRFFSQQFKRSCLPDGPKVGSVAISPRGDWRMPSDACVNAWIRVLEDLT